MVHKRDRVLIDTSGWICFFARLGFPGIKKAIGFLLEENRAAIAGPVFVELIQGYRNEAEKIDIEQSVQGLLWLSVLDRYWHLSAQLSFNLRRRGVTVSAMDALIATITIDYGCQLLHQDKDYNFIAKQFTALKLYNLRQPL